MIKLQVSEEFNSEQFLNYKKKIFQVSDKIDKWHEQHHIQQDKTQDFQNDSEFIGMKINSPDTFSDESDV